MISIIAAVTLDGALGRAGDMIYHLSADLKRFKAITMGHPIVMGRRTFESFPNGPLPGRRNLVVTRNAEYAREGIEVFPTISDALRAAGADAEVFVIGGGEIYALTMPSASRMLITEIDAVAPDADTFFPPVSPHEWAVADEGEWTRDPRSGVRFRYVEYRRRQGRPHATKSPEDVL